jgi:hypothetical protein
MLATTVTVRMRPARSTCNTALSAASLTYQPSTPSQTTSSGVLASSDRRGWRLAGRRLGRPPARQSSAAMLSPRSRAGRVADHHAHPYRRRPWPLARPGQVGVLLAAAAGRQQPVERHLAPAGGQVDCDTVPSPAPCGDEQAAVGGQPYACAASPYIIYTTAGMEILSGVAVSIPLWACSLGSPEIPRTRMRAMSETGPIEPPLPSSTI